MQLMSWSTSCANLDTVDSNLIVILPQEESEEFSLEGTHLLELTSWKLFSFHTDFVREHVC